MTKSKHLMTTLAPLLILAACEKTPTPPAEDSSTPPVASERAEPTTPQEDPKEVIIEDLFTREEVAEIKLLTTPLPHPHDETNEVSGNKRAARMGQFLFFDRRLSKNGAVACSSCHDPNHGFSVPHALGVGQASTPRHPPGLINVAHQAWFDWDGKSDSLWSQASRPLESPAEHGITRTFVARHVVTDPALRSAYEEIFATELPSPDAARAWPLDAMPTPDAPDSPAQKAWDGMPDAQRAQVMVIFTNTLKTLAAYQEQLVTFDSAFDNWARGIQGRESTASDAMSPEAKRGLKRFLVRGKCITCHNGPLFSDMDFHNVGLGSRKWLPEGIDHGRREGVRIVKESELNALGAYSASKTGKRAKWTKFLQPTPEDNGQFRTPGLRGIAQTPPYMHGGHLETLMDVVMFYTHLDEEVQTGHREDSLEEVPLGPAHRRELVEFLKALTPPPLPAELLEQPESP